LSSAIFWQSKGDSGRATNSPRSSPNAGIDEEIRDARRDIKEAETTGDDNVIRAERE
jgi:hypothetical protein